MWYIYGVAITLIVFLATGFYLARKDLYGKGTDGPLALFAVIVVSAIGAVTWPISLTILAVYYIVGWFVRKAKKI